MKKDDNYYAVHLRTRSQTKRTICEVHREIYDILDANRESIPCVQQIICKLEESYRMAKRMDARLIQYKHDYADGWFEEISEKSMQATLDRRSERENK